LHGAGPGRAPACRRDRRRHPRGLGGRRCGRLVGVTTVERVECRRLSVPLHTPFVTSLRRTTTCDTVVVTVTDSDGAVGWGEAPQVWQVTGESLAGAEACLTGPLAATAVGRDVQDLQPAL